jgi:dipeptidyl aminopeptidase/acylaminoacyl peptidase
MKRSIFEKRVFGLKIVGLILILVCGFAFWRFWNAPHYDRPPNDPEYTRILNHFRAAQPIAVNVSPDGKYLVTKVEERGGFKITVLDCETKHEVVSSFSKYTQRSLTWRPDSREIAFQESSGPDRPLYVLDISSGEKRAVAAPISQTALPPLRWSPSGKRLAYFDGNWAKGRLLVINPEQDDQPLIVQTALSSECDYVWSPDGTRIAETALSEGGVVTVRKLSDSQNSSFEILEGSAHELAWSPDGNFILVAARGEKEEFFRLFQLDLATGKATVKAQAKGDISKPVWMPDSKGFIYHVNSNGITRAFFQSSLSVDARLIGPTNGVLSVLAPSLDGQTVSAHFSGLTTPPMLGRISVDDGNWTLLYACPALEACRCPAPEFITLKSAGGVAVPAYHWPAMHKPGVEPAALIVAHGGAQTQTYPTWEAYIRLMTDLGCDVIAENHRGSSGCGRSYERLGGDPVEDVIAACDYAAHVLKVKPSRIFLTGISNGSKLIAGAAAHGGQLGGLFLVSWPGALPPTQPRFDHLFPVLEFHGETDPVMSPGKARQSIEKFFSGDGKIHYDIQYHVFEDEAHFFYKIESDATIYWALSKTIQPGR